MTVDYLAIDIGMTNIDLVAEGRDGITKQLIVNQRGTPSEQIKQAFNFFSGQLTGKTVIGVTGGQYRALPDIVDGCSLIKVDEMDALGLGGLALSGRVAGLIVSAGTGTAMVAAQDRNIEHVTGSAVGGGTLIGLSKLLLDITDASIIDRMAMAGNAARVDVMLNEAVGGEVGRLPANANAVNLGKLAHEIDYSQADLAAGLVRLVAQVIAVIAINAAGAAKLGHVIMAGHMMDMASFCREINLVGEFYRFAFIIPEEPGTATAMGVLNFLKAR